MLRAYCGPSSSVRETSTAAERSGVKPYRCPHPTGTRNSDQLPDHLKIRFEVISPQGNVLASGRNIEALRPLAVEKHEDRLWHEARQTWERDELAGLDFGDLPGSIEVGTDAMGIPQLAYPGLADEEGRLPFACSRSRAAHWSLHARVS